MVVTTTNRIAMYKAAIDGSDDVQNVYVGLAG